MDTETEKELRSEWQSLVKELDEVFEDGLRMVETHESWELWDRAARIRRRIKEIAATGVLFDPPPLRTTVTRSDAQTRALNDSFQNAVEFYGGY